MDCNLRNDYDSIDMLLHHSRDHITKRGLFVFWYCIVCFSIKLDIKKDYSHISRSDFFYFILGIIILATIRYTFILFIIVAIILATNKNTFRKRTVAQLIMFSICICALLITSNYLSSINHNTLYKTAEIIDGNESTYFSFPVSTTMLMTKYLEITFHIPHGNEYSVCQ